MKLRWFWFFFSVWGNQDFVYFHPLFLYQNIKEGIVKILLLSFYFIDLSLIDSTGAKNRKELMNQYKEFIEIFCKEKKSQSSVELENVRRLTFNLREDL